MKSRAKNGSTLNELMRKKLPRIVIESLLKLKENLLYRLKLNIVNTDLDGSKVILMSVTKKHLRQPNKFEDAELQELLDENSAQFTSELVKVLNVVNVLSLNKCIFKKSFKKLIHTPNK